MQLLDKCKALLAAVSCGTRDAAAFGLDARVHLIDPFFPLSSVCLLLHLLHIGKQQQQWRRIIYIWASRVINRIHHCNILLFSKDHILFFYCILRSSPLTCQTLDQVFHVYLLFITRKHSCSVNNHQWLGTDFYNALATTYRHMIWSKGISLVTSTTLFTLLNQEVLG